MDIPHKWPGKKRLYLILAAMRVLGIDEPQYIVVYGNRRFAPYSQLTTKRQKEVYKDFSYRVEARLNQQEK